MRIIRHHLLLGLAFLANLNFDVNSAAAQPTAFTYQGRLDEGGAPANGSYDLSFALFDAASGGTQQGNTRTNEATVVSNGLFTVTLSFGDVPFNGDDRWLEISVRTNGGGGFATLSPRQRITSAPYAIKAANAASAEYLSGTVSASQLTGTIGPTNIAPGSISTAMLAEGAATSDKIGGVLLSTQIPDLDAAKITSGTLAEARLSASVSLLGATIDSVEIVDGTIVNADISASAGIGDSKLATLSTAGKVADSALSANVAQLNRSPQIFTGTNSFTQRLGIGTTAPAADLHVRGSGTNGAVIITPNVSDSQSQILLAENQTASLGFIVRYAGNEGANPLYFIPLNSGGVEGTAVLALERNGGNVGVGTNNPAERLHVAGNVRATGTLQGENLAINGSLMSLGATNLTAIEIKPDGMRALRIENPGDGAADLDPSPDGAPNLVGGSPRNFVSAGVVGVVIAGGGATNYNSVPYSNSVAADFGVIGGGRANEIGAVSPHSSIAGGRDNNIGVEADGSAIGGGAANQIGGGALGSVISGGTGHRIRTNSARATIGGGQANIISTNSAGATIAGGVGNGVNQNSSWSTIGGGSGNDTTINAEYATIPGGRDNTATNYALAAGRNAQATRVGSFVWSDGTGTTTSSFTDHSVTMRASGGFRFLSSTNEIGVRLDTGATAWSITSDRNLKKDFASVDAVAFLNKLVAVPVQQWHYVWESGEATPHVGPMAQDFKAAFFPGRDDKSITTLEFDGVALAAIQGLNQKVESGIAELAEVRAENAALQARLEKLEQLLRQQLNPNAQ